MKVHSSLDRAYFCSHAAIRFATLPPPPTPSSRRSAEVFVECGSEDALVAAEELEIGVYRLVMETPLACTEASLQKAEQRVEVFQV